MKKSIGILATSLFFLIGSNRETFAQTTYTITGTGTNWDNTNSWDANGVPPLSDVTSIIAWNTNKTISFPNATAYTVTYTVGPMTMNNSDVLTIGDGTASNVKLILGASGTPKDLTANNSAAITIKSGGTLEIWGKLVVNNHLSLDVQAGGTLIVHGDVDVANNANIDVSGSVTVGGDFSIGDAGQVTVNFGGSVAVTGAVTSGSATCAVINGTFTTGGGCTDSGTSNNCGGTSQTFCAALPIQLVSFSASVDANHVELKWSTATEINFDYFVLEKSGNGFQFSELAHIKGSGNSNIRKDYGYTDNNPFIGNSYYRLTSIDFDGYTEVFNNSVVRVNVKTEKNFSVAPNPIQSLHLRGSVNFESAHGSVVIFDRMGSVVAKYAVNNSEIDVQLPTLSSGVYFAQFQSGEFSKTVRFAVNE